MSMERPQERGYGDPKDHPIDFDATSGKKKREDKRDYIFSFGNARKCDHPTLRIIARGSNTYRCLECNYAFRISSADMWPLHWLPIMAGFEIMSFVKEFGVEALEKVYTTPIGQIDGTPQKPILPEGKSFKDVIGEMDNLDTKRLGPIIPFPEALAYEAEAHGRVEDNKVIPEKSRRFLSEGEDDDDESKASD